MQAQAEVELTEEAELTQACFPSVTVKSSQRTDSNAKKQTLERERQSRLKGDTNTPIHSGSEVFSP